MNFPIIVICEGASEANYVTQLNRLLIAENGRIPFVPKVASGGRPALLLRTLTKYRQTNRNCQFYILLDEDIYIREPDLRVSLYSKQGTAVIHFNHMNFEDVMMLHEPEEVCDSWISFCEANSHFSVPLPERVYFEKLKEFFPNYSKRELPFELTKERLITAFRNLKRQQKIQSSFLTALENFIVKGLIVYQ